jgi:hypothetical protein
MSMKIQNNPTPEFVQFQNGQQITVDGVTVTTEAPAQRISGDGYDVVTGHNNTFYGICDYDVAGTYTQRHYIAPLNTFSDYSNFHELTVVVAVGTNTETDADASLSNDETVNQLEDFLDSLGFGGTFAKMVFWLVLTFIFAYVGFEMHPLFGLIIIPAMLVVGAMIGFLPFWVVILLVIIAAGIGAVAFRMVFNGGG